MAFIVKGYNEFYEGWLARILEQRQDQQQSVAWQEGWKTADETDRFGRIWALEHEITGSSKSVPHITVTPTKD